MNERRFIRIVHTEGSVIDVMPQKNRIYATLQGGLTESPDRLMEKLHNLSHHLSHGFTMVLDVHEGSITSFKERVLVHDVMELLLEGGISKIADIRQEYPVGHRPQKWRSRLKDAGVQYKVFINREDADAWLDFPGI